MESIKLRLAVTQKAHTKLSHMLIKLRDSRAMNALDEDDITAYRDSVIKRFEISYDLTWKFLKYYFENHLAISVASPKSVFHACFQQGLATEDETRILLNMIDDRNLTVHTYNEDLAEQVSLRIAVYYGAMQALLAKIPTSLQINEILDTASPQKTNSP